MINCAIIGLGRIGSILEDDKLREKPASHAGAYADNPDCRIICGSDISIEKREMFAKKWNSAVYDDYKEMISQNKIDIISIATPSESHEEILTYCVEKNIPVIICEKPLTNNLESALKLFEYCSGKKSQIIINHERRYSLQYRHIKNVINEKLYGSLLSIRASLYMGGSRTVDKILYDDGTHIIDLIRYLISNEFSVINVNGKTREKDTVIISGRSENTAVTIEIGSFRNFIHFELDFSFEKGRIRVGNGYYEEYESTQSQYYENMRSLVKNEKSFSKTEYFKRVMINAVELFKGESNHPDSSIYDGYKAIDYINRIINF